MQLLVPEVGHHCFANLKLWGSHKLNDSHSQRWAHSSGCDMLNLGTKDVNELVSISLALASWAALPSPPNGEPSAAKSAGGACSETSEAQKRTSAAALPQQLEIALLQLEE